MRAARSRRSACRASWSSAAGSRAACITTTAGVEQWVEAVGEPFAPEEVLAAVDGCDWVILGGQTAGDFPPETIAGLAEAGHRVCIDGQGLCRGDAPGPVRLRPFPPDAIRGVSILKLNRAEAEAAAGGLDAGVAPSVLERRRSSSRSAATAQPA